MQVRQAHRPRTMGPQIAYITVHNTRRLKWSVLCLGTVLKAMHDRYFCLPRTCMSLTITSS